MENNSGYTSSPSASVEGNRSTAVAVEVAQDPRLDVVNTNPHVHAFLKKVAREEESISHILGVLPLDQVAKREEEHDALNRLVNGRGTIADVTLLDVSGMIKKEIADVTANRKKTGPLKEAGTNPMLEALREALHAFPEVEESSSRRNSGQLSPDVEALLERLNRNMREDRVEGRSSTDTQFPIARERSTGSLTSDAESALLAGVLKTDEIEAIPTRENTGELDTGPSEEENEELEKVMAEIRKMSKEKYQAPLETSSSNTATEEREPLQVRHIPIENEELSTTEGLSAQPIAEEMHKQTTTGNLFHDANTPSVSTELSQTPDSRQEISNKTQELDETKTIRKSLKVDDATDLELIVRPEEVKAYHEGRHEIIETGRARELQSFHEANVEYQRLNPEHKRKEELGRKWENLEAYNVALQNGEVDRLLGRNTRQLPNLTTPVAAPVTAGEPAQTSRRNTTEPLSVDSTQKISPAIMQAYHEKQANQERQNYNTVPIPHQTTEPTQIVEIRQQQEALPQLILPTDPVVALSAFERALYRNPTDGQAYMGKAKILVAMAREAMAQGQTENAQRLHQRILETCKDGLSKTPRQEKAHYVDLYLSQAYALTATGKPREALQSIDRAAKSGKVSSLEVYKLRAKAFSEMGQPENAVFEYEKAISLQKGRGDFRLYLEMANPLISEGRYEEALAAYDTALELSRRDPSVLRIVQPFLLDLSLMNPAVRKGRVAEQLAEYERALQTSSGRKHREILEKKQELELAVYRNKAAVAITDEIAAWYSTNHSIPHAEITQQFSLDWLSQGDAFEIPLTFAEQSKKTYQKSVLELYQKAVGIWKKIDFAKIVDMPMSEVGRLAGRLAVDKINEISDQIEYTTTHIGDIIADIRNSNEQIPEGVFTLMKIVHKVATADFGIEDEVVSLYNESKQVLHNMVMDVLWEDRHASNQRTNVLPVIPFNDQQTEGVLGAIPFEKRYVADHPIPPVQNQPIVDQQTQAQQRDFAANFKGDPYWAYEQVSVGSGPASEIPVMPQYNTEPIISHQMSRSDNSSRNIDTTPLNTFDSQTGIGIPYMGEEYSITAPSVALENTGYSHLLGGPEALIDTSIIAESPQVASSNATASNRLSLEEARRESLLHVPENLREQYIRQHLQGYSAEDKKREGLSDRMKVANAMGNLVEDPQRSLRVFQEILREDPTNIDAMLGIAEVYLQLGQKKEGQKQCATIIQLEPNNLEYAGEVVDILYHLGDKKGALQQAERVSSLKNSEHEAFALRDEGIKVDVLLIKGNILYEQGNISAAVNAYDMVANLRPEEPAFKILFARSLYTFAQQTGNESDKEDAIAAYREAQLLILESESAVMNRDYVGSLSGNPEMMKKREEAMSQEYSPIGRRNPGDGTSEEAKRNLQLARNLIRSENAKRDPDNQWKITPEEYVKVYMNSMEKNLSWAKNIIESHNLTYPKDRWTITPEAYVAKHMSTPEIIYAPNREGRRQRIEEYITTTLTGHMVEDLLRKDLHLEPLYEKEHEEPSTPLGHSSEPLDSSNNTTTAFSVPDEAITNARNVYAEVLEKTR